jgi:hypothetical protein
MLVGYDTIKFTIPRTRLSTEQIRIIETKLQKNTLHKGYGWNTRVGNVNNFCVKITETQVVIWGSLPKYLCGSNMKSLTLEETKHGIEKLSQDLGIDLTVENVTGFDIAGTMKMEHLPSSYLRCLGNKPGYYRWIFDTSVYYDIGFERQKYPKRQLLFYDKGKELGFPQQSDGLNLLRYELSIQYRLRGQFGKVTGSTLYDPTFFNSVVNLWYDEFNSISKINQMSMCTSHIKTVGEAVETLSIMVLQRYGIDLMNDFLSNLKVSNSFTKRSYYRDTQDLLNELLSKPVEKKSDMLQELKTKVLDTVKNAVEMGII